MLVCRSLFPVRAGQPPPAHTASPPPGRPWWTRCRSPRGSSPRPHGEAPLGGGATINIFIKLKERGKYLHNLESVEYKLGLKMYQD